MTTEAPVRPETSCPVCGADAQSGQLVCLECGSRITLAYRRPPSWKVPVAITALVLLLAAAGGYFAYQALDEDAEREAAAAPAQPRATAAADEPADAGEDPASAADEADQPADDEETTTTDDDDETDAADQAESGDDSGLTRRGGLYVWPPDLRAFTVVLLSTEDRASATSFARSAGSSESNQIGVIRSDDFESLPIGFFIAFSGSYEERDAAERAAGRLGGRFPGAFAQLVRR